MCADPPVLWLLCRSWWTWRQTGAPSSTQSQSFNVHMSDVNFGKLTSLHFYAWKVRAAFCCCWPWRLTSRSIRMLKRDIQRLQGTSCRALGSAATCAACLQRTAVLHMMLCLSGHTQ